MLRLAATAAVALTLTGVAGASAAHPVVPAAVQAQIKRKAPTLAYAPTRVAIGFRYATSDAGRHAVRISFRNKAAWEIVFRATPMSGSCRTGMEQSFQLAGNKVYWSKIGTEQHAWRCVVGPTGRLVRLVAASAQPPEKFAAVGLGSVVASGKRISPR